MDTLDPFHKELLSLSKGGKHKVGHDIVHLELDGKAVSAYTKSHEGNEQDIF